MGKGKREERSKEPRRKEEVNKEADFSGESKRNQAITNRGGCTQRSVKAKIAPDEIKQAKKRFYSRLLQ